MQIIWIDDDVENLESQQEFLRNRGFQVEAIDNVDDAWKRLNSIEDENFGIIIDIMMATGHLFKREYTEGGLKTGIHLLRKLSASGVLSKAKVFIYTLSSSAELFEEANQLKIRVYKKQSAPGKRLVEIALSEFGEP